MQRIPKRNKIIPFSERTIQKKIICISKISITFTLKLPTAYINSHNINSSSFKSVYDINFLQREKSLHQLITISSNNSSLSFLDYLNKTQKNKYLIKIIPLTKFEIISELSDLKPILIKVLGNNNIFIDEDFQCYEPDSFSDINFNIKINEESIEFPLSDINVSNETDTSKEEIFSLPEKNIVNNLSCIDDRYIKTDRYYKKSDTIYNFNESNKKGSQKKLSKRFNYTNLGLSRSIFSPLSCRSQYSNANLKNEQKKNLKLHTTMNNISKLDFNLTKTSENENFYEKGSLKKAKDIFTKLSYFEFSDYEYAYIDLLEIYKLGKSNFSILSPFAKFLRGIKTGTGIQLIINFNFKALVNQKIFNENAFSSLLFIFESTDYFLFEEKETYTLLNMFYLLRKDNEKKEELDKKNMMNFFSEYIVKKTSLKFDKKFCFILNNFNEFSFLKILGKGNNKKDLKISNSKDKIRSLEIGNESFNCQLYPKSNHNNFQIISAYKNELNNNYQKYFGVFFGSFLGNFLKYNNNENVFQSLLISMDTTKKILEINLNGYDIPPCPEFFQISIPQKYLVNNTIDVLNRKKEKSFVLDCINQKSSKANDYNPLKDKHLKNFFRNKGRLEINSFAYKPVYMKSNNCLKTLDLFERKEKKSNKFPIRVKSLECVRNKDLLSGKIHKNNYISKNIDAEKIFLDTISNLKIWDKMSNKELNISSYINMHLRERDKMCHVKNNIDSFSTGNIFV